MKSSLTRLEFITILATAVFMGLWAYPNSGNFPADMIACMLGAAIATLFSTLLILLSKSSGGWPEL